MEEIIFEVQGSTPKPYKVTFIRQSNTNLSAYCTCPAGENGQYCKHRFRIMNGEQIGIVGSNADNVKIIQSWLIGTDVETALYKFIELEKEAEKIKNKLALAKKNLTKALRN